MAVNVISRLKIKNGANEPIAEGPDISASCAVVANTAARDAILTNVKGSSYLVYRVDLPGFEYWNGSVWTAVAGGSGGSSASGFTQTFDASTTDADPGDEEFRLNHATPASATAIYLDDLAADGTNVRDLITSWGALPGTVKGRLTLRDATAPENWITYSVSAYTTATGYGKLTIAVVDSSATVTLAGEVSIEFDAGPTGVLLADGTVALSAAWDVGNQRIDDVRSMSYEGEVDNGNSGAADTIDWTTGALQKSTLTGNCTYTFTAPQPWTAIQLRVVQDATGGRTVTWPGSVIWDVGYAPNMADGPSVETIISGYYDGTNYYLVNPDRGFRIVTEAATTRVAGATDANSLIKCTNASGCVVTVHPFATVPWQKGTVILLKQSGAAQAEFSEGAGVTIDTTQTLKTEQQHSVIGIIYEGSDVWTCFGERELA